MSRTAADLTEHELELMNRNICDLDLPPPRAAVLVTYTPCLWPFALHTKKEVLKWRGIGPAVLRSLDTLWKEETGNPEFPFGLTPNNPKLLETIDLLNISPYLKNNLRFGHPRLPTQERLWSVCSMDWFRVEGYHPWHRTELAFLDFELLQLGLHRGMSVYEALGIPRRTMRPHAPNPSLVEKLTQYIPPEDLSPAAWQWLADHTVNNSALALWQALKTIDDCPRDIRIELNHWLATRKLIGIELHSVDVHAVLHNIR